MYILVNSAKVLVNADELIYVQEDSFYIPNQRTIYEGGELTLHEVEEMPTEVVPLEYTYTTENGFEKIVELALLNKN